MKQRLFSYRLDDITEDMDWDKFYRMKDIFDTYNVKPLIGVVPKNLDSKLKRGGLREDFWEILRSLQASGWKIAQHGYEHRYVTTDSGLLGLKNASEFAGVPYEEQYEKLRRGKNILEEHGIRTDIFMAPGHTYDRLTLKALRNNGFRYVTDGYTDCLYEYEGLVFVPCKSASRPLGRGIDTVCLHTNGMEEQDFKEAETLIRAKRGLLTDYGALMECMRPKKRGWAVRLQERRNLRVKRLRKALTADSRIQDFMKTHYHPNPYIKMLKRICGLPGLCLRLMKR